jgi:hypothetical protein
MVLKTGEATVILEDSIFHNAMSYLYDEYKWEIDEKSKIIISLDGELIDTYDNLNFEYGYVPNDDRYYIPSWFFKRLKPSQKFESLGSTSLWSKKIFSSMTSKKRTYSSTLTCGYKCNKKECFGIVKIRTNFFNPCFYFEYDEEMLTKQEVVYLINMILRFKFTEY